MIGIYKITKKENGKSYIGQSNDIQRRFKEHQTKGRKTRIAVDWAIEKYGIDAFTYEIVEECSLEELNEKEEYWIKYFNTKNDGYNLTDGGNQQSVGENNGRAKLTEEDIAEIRQAYNQHLPQREVYKKFQNKTTFGNFQAVWQGSTWKYIMPEVYTEENKQYYKTQTSLGENSTMAKLTDEEVIKCRQRYVREDAKTIYQDYKDKIKYQTFQGILWGRTYKNLPIYKKKEQKWINI